MSTAITLSLPLRGDQPARQYEWLITNGLGGYASGSLAGVNTRRYHGVFMPNLQKPKGRHLLISRLDEKIIIDDKEYQLGGTDTDDALNATALQWLKSFTIDNNTACWIYELGPLRLEKILMMPHQQNTVCIRYRALTDVHATMQLRPYLPFRRQDAELTTEPTLHFKVSINNDQCEFTASNELSMYIATQPAPIHFISEKLQADNQLLTRERARGAAYHESTLSPGYFVVNFNEHRQASFIASAHPWDSVEKDIDKTFDAEAKRIHAIEVRAGNFHDDVETREPMIAKLTVAADQFLVEPGSRLHEAATAAAEGHQLRSVIAGYHWFSDWGRDTMIALEGLMLCTGRFQEARATLLTFSHYVKDGLLPNLFPEGERVGLYHTVDATLWYFHAIHRYIKRSGDEAILTEMLPILRTIIQAHLKGTLFGIHADADGLLTASSADHPLTWMDAHMGDWIVTPRRGKPVEIQALWYNALILMSRWDNSSEAVADYSVLAAQVRASFNRRFWIEQQRYLFDVIDGENGNDAKLRPNQIFTISLDHPVLEHDRWKDVIDTVHQHLLTPFGLRTLSPDDPDYQRTYGGSLQSRDGAYHQGTVWPWLLGHFIEALLKVDNDRTKARQLLTAFEQHLNEAGIGSISEVFDAESPHEPHGCIAQAWSVAEILRAWHLTTSNT